ncbi:MAG: aminomethyl-transferring glycine dehydrogenase subunit GcvPB, partial [Candidatus Tectomicrobia bacterium]|nr:aminomethyl-transferring glycine dehydrogenase subunit GcvPB [Candidatus Tectomicrobia bacterium]
MNNKASNNKKQEIIVEPLIFELGSPGRTGVLLPEIDVPCTDIETLIPKALIRQDGLGEMPELSQPEVVRHFTKLSKMNYGVDQGFYPLGSCTMKYNPKINEDVAKMAGFAKTHPYQRDELAQGLLQVLWQLGRYLAEIGGVDDVSLHPAAGAQGELTGLLIMRAFHEGRGEDRGKILLPDSAHGTNPASSSLAGYDVVEVHSDSRGCLNPKSVTEVMDEQVAGLMITLPNTLGLFEEDIGQIIEVVHKKGGLVYCDGANLNAMLGLIRPGNLGVDILHYNLHKTFSTPHGGGGPGAGPVGVKKELAQYLPIPIIEKCHDREEFFLNYNRPKSIGKVRAFLGNVGVLIRAYVYIRSLGPEGLKRMAEMAIINANYLK